jgi:hypothetical protein
MAGAAPAGSRTTDVIRDEQKVVVDILPRLKLKAEDSSYYADGSSR